MDVVSSLASDNINFIISNPSSLGQYIAPHNAVTYLIINNISHFLF